MHTYIATEWTEKKKIKSIHFGFSFHHTYCIYIYNKVKRNQQLSPNENADESIKDMRWWWWVTRFNRPYSILTISYINAKKFYSYSVWLPVFQFFNEREKNSATWDLQQCVHIKLRSRREKKKTVPSKRKHWMGEKKIFYCTK